MLCDVVIVVMSLLLLVVVPMEVLVVSAVMLQYDCHWSCHGSIDVTAAGTEVDAFVVVGWRWLLKRALMVPVALLYDVRIAVVRSAVVFVLANILIVPSVSDATLSIVTGCVVVQ